jgi:putative glutamine amidotransferase
MRPPIIGITTYARNDEGRFVLPAGYVDAVRRAGGIPLLIPPGEERLDELLALVDGLILSGGGDLDPAHYGSPGHPTVYLVNAERDGMELALARRMAAGAQPALFICRGLQVLNVALGGSLVEHLPDVVDGPVQHRLEPSAPTSHTITALPGGKVAELMGEQPFAATSWHHQAVRRLAPSLVVAACAADGTVEAVELPGHPWLLAVQWHPEMTAADDPMQQRLFDAFVAAAARREGITGQESSQPEYAHHD